MNGFEEMISAMAEKNAERYRKIIMDELNKKEAPTMQVTYNGFTGELVKLERRVIPGDFIMDRRSTMVYDLSLYDSEKQVTISFTGVKLEDVKFLGGTVAFGG